jgi:hypothetical protein
VGIFPNEDAIVRLVGAILLEQNHECDYAPENNQTAALGNLCPKQRKGPPNGRLSLQSRARKSNGRSEIKTRGCPAFSGARPVFGSPLGESAMIPARLESEEAMATSKHVENLEKLRTRLRQERRTLAETAATSSGRRDLIEFGQLQQSFEAVAGAIDDEIEEAEAKAALIQLANQPEATSHVHAESLDHDEGPE